MARVLATETAVLVEFELAGRRLLVLRRHVVAALAFVAPQSHVITHVDLPFLPRREVARALLDDLGDRTGADRAAALADREAQPLVHRDRRDQLDTIVMLSPGITISTPSGSVAVPVTSVVRK